MKIKIGVVSGLISGVISSTESESKVKNQDVFIFFPTPLTTPPLTFCLVKTRLSESEELGDL